MSTSQHPVALGLQRQVGDATKLLATVMGLPLVDGIFPALVLAGALNEPLGVLQIGLLVFGGSATVAVILAETEGHPHDQLTNIAVLGVGLAVVAGAEAALAPTIKSMLAIATFERFAALVMFAVAAKTASSTIGDYLPRPAVIIGLGMIASFEPANLQFALTLKPGLVLRAAGAALVGTAFALGVAFFGPTLRNVLDIDRFRFGSAVALGMLPLSVLGHAPGNAPLAVLVVTGLLAFDPDSALANESAPAKATVTDGGHESDDRASDDTEPVAPDGYGYPGDEAEREPWL